MQRVSRIAGLKAYFWIEDRIAQLVAQWEWRL